MGMTNASMDSQTRQARSLEGATEDAAALADGLAAVPVVIQAQDPTIASLKPGDSASWNHCDVKNDYKNTQEG